MSLLAHPALERCRDKTITALQAARKIRPGQHVFIGTACVATVIAEANPEMPRTTGDSTLHPDHVDWLVPVVMPVIEYAHAFVEDEAVVGQARCLVNPSADFAGVPPENAKRVALARSGGENIPVRKDEDVVHVTTTFRGAALPPAATLEGIA